MSSYFAIVFCALEQGAVAWAQAPRDKIAAAISEYRYVAEQIASQHGNIYQNFSTDGHLFLFDNADTALQFGYRLIEAWCSKGITTSIQETPFRIPLRIGCHFGECTQLQDGEVWVSIGINIAKAIAEEADSDSIFLTSTILDMADLPLYSFEEAGTFGLENDYLSQRPLLKLTAFKEEALRFKPEDSLRADDWFLKAVAFIGTQKENSEEEAECYRQALNLRADYAEAHNNLAVLLRASGEDSKASEHYREALRIRPDYPEAHYNYAVCLQTRGSLAGAAEHYREALRLRPDYVDAHYGYANLLRANGDVENAEKHYIKVLQLRPEYAEVHNNYAILLEDKRDAEGAQRRYREALRIQPDYPEAHYNYAILRENEGDIPDAEAHYREALRLRWDYPEAHNNLAILLQGRGDLVSSEQHYQEALHLMPNDPATHYNYALLLKTKGDPKADERLRIAYEIAPSQWLESIRSKSISKSSIELTKREMEVLRLISSGKSNRDIADELVISLSTVAHHVTNILNKLGVTNRTEAATYATQHGLVSK